jgi:hypothetical protein
LKASKDEIIFVERIARGEKPFGKGFSPLGLFPFQNFLSFLSDSCL